ncbi:MAG: helix-turn-helix domain-containing protein [Brevibacterium yomogidense]
MSSVQAAPAEWLTVEQFAAELGIPKQTVYVWRTKGKGPRAHKIGRHVRFSRQSVNEWLAEQQEADG